MAVTPPLHDALEPLRELLGTWEGDGEGAYPTIEPFTYREEVVFGQVGKPMLTYRQRTWNPEDGTPMHAEVGYLRAVGAGRLELVLAHPFGIVEVEEGTVDGGVIELRSTVVAGSSTAKPVHTLRRRFELRGDELGYDLWMAHGETPETHHLAARLHRVGRTRVG